ncbi:F-box protein CPR1-like [Malus sylvestris]|uniref:F-box protein CPR1-like n=1 Tax=Malus sylvestris TaxID=3752 RepID=UPI0021ABCB05|nr:F-box protein CPR1-like [Malus sylvestris]
MIHNYPEDIIHDILFRLPTKSLIRCTSVCKPGNYRIKNPSFIRTQLSRTINLNNQSDAHLLLLYCVCTAPIEEHCNLRYDNLAFDEYCKLEFPILPREELYNKFLHVVGVCNGLVFLADDKDYLGYTFMLWNPSIRKSVTLPNPHLTFETISKYYACIGFGFDAVTNDYKVVRLITEQCEDPNIFYEVYSLAGGSWSDPRSLDFACEVQFISQDNGTKEFHNLVLNATVYFRCELVCPDLVSKQFKNLGIHGYEYYYAESYVESLVLLDKTDAVSY